MPEDPFYIRWLDKLGVNTTRLRWRLYQLERKGKHVSADRGLPSALHWLRYPHKICLHCGAVNDRNDRICHRCERNLPSMTRYRFARVLGLMMPENAPAVMTAFMAAALAVYAATVLLDGFAILMQSPGALYLLGAFTHLNHPVSGDWWRMFSFSLVHGGIIHIGFNLFALSQIGPLIESPIGPRRMLILITVTQLSAAIGTYFWFSVMQGGRPFLTVGASGWLCGLLGFGIVYFRDRGRGPSPYRQPMIQWAIYVILFGLIIGANNAAHIGGMAGGMLFAFLSGQDPAARNTPAQIRLWNAAFWACAILWGLTAVLMLHSAVSNWGMLGET